jgi:hypothetical protein
LGDKLDFVCRILTISEDDYGCIIDFSSGQEDEQDELLLIDSSGSNESYLTMERSYPEKPGEVDWYTIKHSKDTEAIFSQMDKMVIKISRDRFEMDWSNQSSLVGLDISEYKYKRLIKILKMRFSEMVIFL